MRNPSYQGVITGFILSLFLIVGFYLMLMLPKDTSISAYSNLALYIIVVSICTWISLKQLSKKLPLNVNAMVFSLLTTICVTAVLFSTATYCYARFVDPSHLPSLLAASKQNWAAKNYSVSVIAGQGEWTWYSSPWNYALMEVKVLLVTLTVITAVVGTFFYFKNKNRITPVLYSNNPELIY